MVSANFQNNNSNFNNVNTIKTVTLASEHLFKDSNDNTRNNKIELIPVESSQHHFLNQNSQDPSIHSISEEENNDTSQNQSIEMEHALKEMNDTFSNLNASGILVENMVCNTNDETDGYNVNLTNEEFDDMVEELSSGGELSEEESKPVDQDLIIPHPTQKNDTNNTESSDTTALLSPNGGWLEKQLGQKPQPQIIPCGFKPQYEIPKYKPGPNYGPTSQAPQQELPRVQREKARSRQSSAANSNGNSLANSPEVSDADDADAFSDTETDVKPPHFLINKNSNNNPANEANNASTPGSPTATTATTTVSASEQLFNMNQGSSLSKETLEKVAIFLKEKEPCANSPLAAANYCPEEVLCLPTKEFNQFLKQNFSETQITLLKSSRRRMKNRLYAKGSRERKRPAKGSRTSPGVSPSPSNMGKASSTARYNHRDRYEYSDTESPYSSLNSSPSSSPLSSPPSTPRHMNATAMEEYFSNKMKQKTSNKNMKPRHKTF